MIAYKYAATERQSRPDAEMWGKLFVFVSVASWALTPALGFRNVLTMLVLAGFAFAVIGLRKPALGLIGISVLCTLDPMTRVYLLTGGLLRWNSLNYLLLLIMFLSFPLVLRTSNLQTRLLILFLIVMIIGLLFSQNIGNGLQHTLGITITFGILIYFIRAIHDPDALYWSAIVCSWLAAAGGLVYFTLPSLADMNANAWAFFPLTAIISASLAAHSLNDQNRNPLTLFVLTGINIVWVFLSGSRGDLAITSLCVLVLLIASKRVSVRVLLLVAIALTVLSISNQFESLRQNTIGRITRTFDPSYSLLQRTSGRSDLIKAGWYIFMANPLGVGTGGFAPAWAELGTMEGQINFRYAGREFQAHAGWIKVLAENGVPGIVLLGAFVLSFAIVGWRKRVFPMIGFLVTGSLSIALMATEFQGKGLWYLAAAGIVFLNRESIIKDLAYYEQSGRYSGRYRRPNEER